ncbi:outer membrane beta-barrel domain-containing protein [Ideonella sp. DXS29W]|uniref:Outer membrane beta-barrel domain-containing protein n=1 Tax=Ideonella lacteola TaxID=2984193 RepID=A0ABU9BU96_9BURK
MRKSFVTLTAALVAALALPSLAAAQAQTQTNTEQVVVPQVDRREIQLPKFPSNDFEVGLYGGLYSTQNFGSSVAGGLRATYHITEDFFVEGAVGQTTVSDEAFRRILPGGIFTDNEEKLIYSNFNVGMNVLPGEVFFWRDRAMPSQVFILAGGGTTRFNGQRMKTIDVGVGIKVYMADWLAVRVDMRDNIYTLDLLGKRDSTHNIELNAGLSFLF